MNDPILNVNLTALNPANSFYEMLVKENIDLRDLRVVDIPVPKSRAEMLASKYKLHWHYAAEEEFNSLVFLAKSSEWSREQPINLF